MNLDITLEPLDLDHDIPVVHAWVTHPRSRFWMMQDASVETTRAAYAAIGADPHHRALLGRVGGRPRFLAEVYDPAHADGMRELPDLEPGDLGMHLLVAPPEGEHTPGLTTAIFDSVMAHCFADPSVARVVVEPDADNRPIRAKNIAAGFVELREIELPGKTAMLSVCTRADWQIASTRSIRVPDRPPFAAQDDPGHHTAHLNPEVLDRAQRRLVAKALAEFAHERLIAPQARGENQWRVEAGAARYDYSARVYALEHWSIDPPSITRSVNGAPAAPDAQELIAELAPALEIPPSLLPVYLEEVASTLASTAWKMTHRQIRVADLVDADYQQLESAMTEGHPAFVANNGRIGFGLDDYLAYAPEAGNDVRLHWLAARRDLTRLSVTIDLSEDRLYAEEVSAELRQRFDHRIHSLGLNPRDYLLLPVHPWQWRNKLSITFAPDLARRDLVYLGAGDDLHRPQQSIRTFFNTTRPERHYVKTALAIQNMGFVRGLSPAFMEATPAINDWVAALVESDPELRRCGFQVLREVAAIGYTGDAFHQLAERSPYRRMIASLWRESPIPRTRDGDRLATMAALLHRDAYGDSLVTAWIKASPLDAPAWVRRYLDVYLRPLVHCLLAHDVAFMPHGENLLIRLRDHVPVGAFMKDIGEEVAVMNDRSLPAELDRIQGDVDSDIKALAVHTDIFDGVLRFVASILDEDGMLSQDEFWAIVSESIACHAADHPELAQAVADYNLTRPRFRHSCLNRLQLRNTLHMVDISDQAESLIFAGTLANPIARG